MEGDGAETRNTKNAPFRARFSCFVLVGGGELPKHEEHTLMGVFFVVWEEGMGWGWRRNTKPEERARNGAFFGFRDGGGWRTSQTRRTHPYRCVLCGWEEGMGVEVLGEGEDVSRHEKKKKKKAGVPCTPCPLLSRAPLAPPGPPLCVPSCLSRFRCVTASSFVLLCCCRRGHLGGVSGLFQHSWGIVWRVLTLTQRVGNGSGGGSGVW